MAHLHIANLLVLLTGRVPTRVLVRSGVFSECYRLVVFTPVVETPFWPLAQLRYRYLPNVVDRVMLSDLTRYIVLSTEILFQFKNQGFALNEIHGHLRGRSDRRTCLGAVTSGGLVSVSPMSEPGIS
ncbi:hypothetical protein EAE96_008226 [Botrytis aclada]|nr:hypothetical protein EAE96_008226 [Botrytis aclada]